MTELKKNVESIILMGKVCKYSRYEYQSPEKSMKPKFVRK